MDSGPDAEQSDRRARAIRRRQGRAVLGGLLAAALAALAAGLAACKGAPATVPIQVEIGHRLGEQPLVLGREFALPSGEQLTVEHLRYYLSNLRLRRRDGSWSESAHGAGDARGYYLVDESRPASKQFTVDGFAPGDYEGIEFLIGVDAARNAAGAQVGALDPAQGMFWTWNSGYIFFKLEGRSPQSRADNQRLVWHVGGSRTPDNSRRVYLPLGAKTLKLSDDFSGTVHLVADLATLFAADGGLRIAEQATVMEPKGGAAIADRYPGVFRVDHLHLEPRPR